MANSTEGLLQQLASSLEAVPGFSNLVNYNLASLAGMPDLNSLLAQSMMQPAQQQQTGLDLLPGGVMQQPGLPDSLNAGSMALHNSIAQNQIPQGLQTNQQTAHSQDTATQDTAQAPNLQSREALVKRKTAAMMERMAQQAQQAPLQQNTSAQAQDSLNLFPANIQQSVDQLFNLNQNGTTTLPQPLQPQAPMQQIELPVQMPAPAPAAAPAAARPSKRSRADSMNDYEPPIIMPKPNQRKMRTEEFNAQGLIGSIFLRVQGASGHRAPGPLVHFDSDVHQPQWFREGIDGVQPVQGPDDFDLESVCLESMGKLVDGNVLPATLLEVAKYFEHVLGGSTGPADKSVPRVLIAIQCDRAKGWFTYKRDHDNANFVPVVMCAAENGRGLEEVSPAHFEVHRAQCAQKKWRQSFKVLGAQKLHKITSLAQAALGDVLRHLERILGGADRPLMVKALDPAGHLLPMIPSRVTHVPGFRTAPLGAPLDLALPDLSMATPMLGGIAGLPPLPGAGMQRPGSALPPSMTPPLVPGGAKGTVSRRGTVTSGQIDPARGLDALAHPPGSPRAGLLPSGAVGATNVLHTALNGLTLNDLLSLANAEPKNSKDLKPKPGHNPIVSAMIKAMGGPAAFLHHLLMDPTPPTANVKPGDSALANPILSSAEKEAIESIIKGVNGADVAHAVRGILQHVAMQYGAADPAGATTGNGTSEPAGGGETGAGKSAGGQSTLSAPKDVQMQL